MKATAAIMGRWELCGARLAEMNRSSGGHRSLTGLNCFLES